MDGAIVFRRSEYPFVEPDYDLVEEVEISAEVLRYLRAMDEREVMFGSASE